MGRTIVSAFVTADDRIVIHRSPHRENERSKVYRATPKRVARLLFFAVYYTLEFDRIFIEYRDY